MISVVTEKQLTDLLEISEAVLLLFGGAHCGVCQAIKPQLKALVAREFPRVTTAYIDCQQAAMALCASQGIFSLPVVQLWFQGQRFAEFARVFSIADIRQALERPYQLL
ncbi:thioredoxin [Marinobacter fuscus]|uniref:Thioredoxin n=2 Tax=Marinobacter fuscus TaxID=2109942 RepID=A0A2T1KJ37_9GAMM|nr:thioredoxin [Marinobacter fuscus]